MRAFATELAVNLRKESLEQMATAALQAKLAEMTVRRTAARPQPLSGTVWAGCVFIWKRYHHPTTASLSTFLPAAFPFV